MSEFPILDKYMGICLEVDLASLAPSRTLVNEWKEWPKVGKSGKWACVVHWLWMEDDRCVLNVPPGFKEVFAPLAGRVEQSEGLLDAGLLKDARPAIDLATAKSGLQPAKDEDIFQALILACNSSLFKKNATYEVQRLTDSSVAAAEGVTLPESLSADRIAYGALEEGEVVSVAFSRDTGIMSGQVAMVSVHTAPAWRGKGYAKGVVSAVMNHVISSGGEACYRVSPDNAPSVAIANSLGCVPYGKYVLVFARL